MKKAIELKYLKLLAIFMVLIGVLVSASALVSNYHDDVGVRSGMGSHMALWSHAAKIALGNNERMVGGVGLPDIIAATLQLIPIIFNLLSLLCMMVCFLVSIEDWCFIIFIAQSGMIFSILTWQLSSVFISYDPSFLFPPTISQSDASLYHSLEMLIPIFCLALIGIKLSAEQVTIV